MSEQQKRDYEITPILAPPKKPRRGPGLREAAFAAGFAATLGAVECCSHKEDPTVKGSGAETVDWGSKSVEFNTRAGDWQFFVFDQVTVSLENAKEKNLHDWLWNFVRGEEWFKKLPAEDRQAYIDGMIAATKKLNPDLNIDNFALVKKSPNFKLPIRFLADPNPARVYSKTEGGYSRLQDLALADGFDLRAGHQQEIFDAALTTSVEIPADVHFYLDRKGSEDSQPRLAPDVIRRLDLLGQAFEEQSFGGRVGWEFAVTDVMRDPPAQAKRKSIGDSTHVTARSFDVSNGRFLTPDKTVITWSAFRDGRAIGPGPNHELIESMYPKLEELSGEYGVVLFREGSHWHAYVPEARKIDLRVPLARYLAGETAKTAEEPVKIEEPEKNPDAEGKSDEEEKPGVFKRLWRKMFGHKESDIEPPAIPVENGTGAEELRHQLSEIFFSSYQEIQAERFNVEESRVRMAELQPAIDTVFAEAFPKKKVEHPFITILAFGNFSPENRKAYGHLTFEQLSEKMTAWRTSENKDERKKWRAISQAWLKDRVIELVRRMPQSEVERLGILQGTTLQLEGRPAFYDLRGIWEWKTKHRILARERKYAEATLGLDLAGESHSVDMGTWYQKELVSTEILRRHARELRIRPEVAEYLTPEVMLAVMNAEFFSEFDARAFVDVSPVVFAPYNIVFGPAVNDRRFSSGPVQLVVTTFIGILNNDSRRLERIKESENGSINFLIPKKDERRRYDTAEIARVMTQDVDSIIFYATYAVADHTRDAFRVLFADEHFCQAWENASDADRELFLGSLAPLAINGGGRTAKEAARSLLGNRGLTSLRAMAEDLPNHTNVNFAKRGSAIGFETMDYILSRVEDN